jgi:hypothetical protein
MKKAEDPFSLIRETNNLNESKRRKKEQAMLTVLDKLCREFIVEDSLSEKPIAASPASYEFVSEFFDKYHGEISKELYGPKRHAEIVVQKQNMAEKSSKAVEIANEEPDEFDEPLFDEQDFIEDAKDFLMVALEKIRAEAEGAKLTLPPVKAIAKKIEKRKQDEQPQPPIKTDYLTAWEARQPYGPDPKTSKPDKKE